MEKYKRITMKKNFCFSFQGHRKKNEKTKPWWGCRNRDTDKRRKKMEANKNIFPAWPRNNARYEGY